MAITDWDLFTRITEQTIPSDITTLINAATPLVGAGSLGINDAGNPAIATIAIRPKSTLFPTLLNNGRVRSVFERKTGSGFRVNGFYFLSSGKNPTLDGVKGYATYLVDGGNFLRVAEFTNGLHDITGFTTLTTHITPNSGSNEPVVMEAEWIGGIIAETLGVTQIETRFGSNTTDFSNLVDFPVTVDPFPNRLTGFVGMWVRSRNASEPLDALIDSTSIWEREFI